MITKKLFILSLTSFILSCSWVMETQANSYNLWVSGLYIDQDIVSQGDTINLSYQLRATKPLFGRLDMSIFIRSGPRGNWFRKWSIPTSGGRGMDMSGGYNSSMTVRIPDWPDGTYYVGLRANAKKFLSENNYDDDYMEIPIQVMRPRNDGIVIRRKRMPLGSQGKYPYNQVCGHNILVVYLDLQRIFPGGEFDIEAHWIRKDKTMPGFKIKMETDGGIFPSTGRNILTGKTDQNGLVQAQWKSPSYPNNGTGEVHHTLKVSVFSGQGIICTKQVPLTIQW